MDASEWTTLEGEDALSLGLIGAGGYGEIHEVIISLFIVSLFIVANCVADLRPTTFPSMRLTFFCC